MLLSGDGGKALGKRHKGVANCKYAIYSYGVQRGYVPVQLIGTATTQQIVW